MLRLYPLLLYMSQLSSTYQVNMTTHHLKLSNNLNRLHSTRTYDTYELEKVHIK